MVLLEMLNTPVPVGNVTALAAEVPLLTRVLIVFPVIVIAPEPIGLTVSIAVIVVATYDKMFWIVLPVTDAAFRPLNQMAFVYTVVDGDVNGGVPGFAPAVPIVLFEIVTPVETEVAAPLNTIALAH